MDSKMCLKVCLERKPFFASFKCASKALLPAVHEVVAFQLGSFVKGLAAIRVLTMEPSGLVCQSMLAKHFTFFERLPAALECTLKHRLTFWSRDKVREPIDACPENAFCAPYADW